MSRVFPDEFGSQVTSPAAIDANDAFMVSVDGLIKNVAPGAARGYIDASHYPDLDEVVINPCEAITGFVCPLGTQDDGVPGSGTIQLDPAVFSHGANSVRARFWINRTPVPGSMYWNAPADIPIVDHVEAAFNFRTDMLGNADDMLRAFVATGVDRTGTVNYAADLTLQFPTDADHHDTWYTVRVPLTGMTAIRSIGVTQKTIPITNTSTRGLFWFDHMVFREATGIDRAIYGAPAGSHIVIPANYTSAKTQLPIFREQAGITWEDRRT